MPEADLLRTVERLTEFRDGFIGDEARELLADALDHLSAGLEPRHVALDVGRAPHAEWSEVSEEVLASITAKMEPLLRKAADSLYGDLLDFVQDNLTDNAGFNIGQRIASAERQSLRARLRASVLLETLKGVRHWASRRCPCGPPEYPVDEPKICPLCSANIDDPTTWCKAVEAIFPRELLAKVDAAIAQAEAA